MEEIIGKYMLNGELNMTKVVDNYYNYINTIVRNSNILKQEDQEDIISDVFLILWKNQNKLEKNAKFSPYISGVTKNLIYKKYKELNLLNKFDEYEERMIDCQYIDDFIENKAINEFIIEQLKMIGNIETEIFTKFYYEDKSVKRIAKELNLSVSNVKTKLHRTRKKLKNILDIGGVL